MSKFDGILSVKAIDNPKTKLKKPEVVAQPETSIHTGAQTQTKRKGKRSDPDYTQITAYIKKSTHEDVMRKIYKRQEFSELLEELLNEWLKQP
jgi:hypothetical protein